MGASTVKREFNLEALRIYSMFFIVLTHMKGYLDMNFWDAHDAISRFINAFVNSAGVGAVDCFILITGFFMIRDRGKIERVLNIYITTTFYLVAITLLFYLSGKATMFDLLKSFFPLAPTKFNYWFVSKYLALMLLCPFLSRLATNLDRRQYLLLLSGLLLINTELAGGFPFGGLYGGAFSLMWFICLFFIGGYIRLFIPDGKYDMKILFAILIAAISTHTIAEVFGGSYIVLGYDSVITLIISVCLFMIFRSWSIPKSRIIRMIAPNTFSIYLIHNHFLMRGFLSSVLCLWIPESGIAAKTLYMLFCTVGVYLASVCIDKLRVILFKTCGMDAAIAIVSKWLYGLIGTYYSKIERI